MSETNTEAVVTETKAKKFSLRDLVWVLIGVVVGILIGWAVFTATLSSTATSVQTPSVGAATTVENVD